MPKKGGENMKKMLVLLVVILVTLSGCCSFIAPESFREEAECFDAVALAAAACTVGSLDFDLQLCIEANTNAALECGTDL
jgi:hypothetical protein